MRNESGTVDYYLFFASNNLTRLARMKDAMWKVDPMGDFTFSDATDAHQSVLFAHPNFDRLEHQIVDRFKGLRVGVEQIERFVLAETAFGSSHFKRILKRLEGQGRLSVVVAKPGRKLGTFPNGTVIAFP